MDTSASEQEAKKFKTERDSSIGLEGVLGSKLANSSSVSSISGRPVAVALGARNVSESSILAGLWNILLLQEK